MPSTSISGALLRAARAGELAALEELIVVCQPEVRRYAQRSCFVSDVDDAVQESLLVMSRYLAALREPRAWSGWAFRVVRHICHRLARTTLRYDLWGDDAVDELIVRAESELRHDIAAAIQSLPEPYREVIVLRDFEGLTIGELATSLKTTPAAIKGKLHRARELTREYLVGESAS